MGLAVSALLTAVTFAASLAVVLRARLAGRAEMVVAGTLVWNLLVAVPIYVLGLAGALTAGTLALASVLLSAAAVALAARGADRRAVAAEGVASARSLARVPLDALRLTFRERSPVLLAVLGAAAIAGTMTIAAYLGPEIGYWDALWYHQPIIGFTIQNHGFAVVPLPDSLQKVNGYPRLAEMTQLWFAIFAGRRLLDLANLVFVPALACGGYLLARQAGVRAVAAIGCGAGLVLFPGMGRVIQSSYVDLQNAAVLLGGIVFATRVPLRARDAGLACVGLALAVGSKGLSLAPAAVTSAIVAVRLWRAAGPGRRRAALATLAGGGALVVAALATIYLRNYLNFKNPLWPDLSVKVRALGIDWPGLVPWSADPKNPAAWHLNVNVPFADLVGYLLAIPYSVKGQNIDQTVDYGMGVGWIALPLGLLGGAACLWAWARAFIARRRGGDAPDLPPPPAPVVLWLVPVLVSIVVQSPALWCPRYHTVAVAVLMTWMAWLETRGWARLVESGVTAFALLSLMTIAWVTAPHWMPSPSRLLEQARHTPAERETMRELGSSTTSDVGAKRNQELGPGELLVFNDRYAGFPSLFWNDDFSNRIAWLGGDDATFLARAKAAGAKWVFLIDRDPSLAAARAPGSGWQEVGVLNAVNGGRAFRRAP